MHIGSVPIPAVTGAAELTWVGGCRTALAGGGSERMPDCVHWGCVLGQPAAGKTKQAELLAEAFPDDVCVISVPQLLRKVPGAADAISAGRLVSDDVVDTAVENELEKVKEGAIVLLAGYPATRAQAQRMSTRNGVARFAVALNFSEDTARQRILQSSQSDVADERLATYREHTSSVVANLQTTAGLLVVDGSLKEQDVHKQLRARLLSPPLVPRELVPQSSPKSSTDGKTSFSVCQMNVLADGLSGNNAKRGGFSLIPAMYLDWEQRSQMLLKALSQAGDGDDSMPDIVALQEADHLDDFWNVQMRDLGYDGAARVDERSPCLSAALAEPKLPDSVAVFWRREVFELAGEAGKGVDVQDEDGAVVHKSKMLFLQLRMVATGDHIAVVNCHLDSRKNKSGQALRAKQSELILSKLTELAENTSALIICGDMNATRGERCHDSIL